MTLGYHSMELRYFPNISQAVQKRFRQLVYTVFLGNNRASFHFWGKKNLVKQQKVLKYYENDCLQKFFFAFYVCIDSSNC